VTLRRPAGFSFIELMASLAIMGVLLLIVLPSAEVTVRRHREAELRMGRAQIRGAIDQYKKAVEAGKVATKIGESGYPPSLEMLAEGVADASSPTARKIYLLRRIPADPFYSGQTKQPEETWALRSYDSPPDAPEAGDDVFDVYSMSPGIGLNGVAYRDW